MWFSISTIQIHHFNWLSACELCIFRQKGVANRRQQGFRCYESTYWANVSIRWRVNLTTLLVHSMKTIDIVCIAPFNMQFYWFCRFSIRISYIWGDEFPIINLKWMKFPLKSETMNKVSYYECISNYILASVVILPIQNMSSDNTVKVAVRIRPLVKSEKNRGCQSIVHKTANEPQVVVNSGLKTSEMYTYNYVFAPEDTQEMIYENAVKSMVMKLFAGYNVTILAYGQTGSGKTHTMGTTFNGIMDDEMGVIPRAVGEIFEKIASTPEDEFNVSCSFVELYQEKLYDLLSDNAREQSIVDIREVEGKVVIPNLTEKIVMDTVQTTTCLMQGSSDRAVGATAMNAQSSRSHAIFTVTVQKVFLCLSSLFTWCQCQVAEHQIQIHF